jgi:hypothetical protein
MTSARKRPRGEAVDRPASRGYEAAVAAAAEEEGVGAVSIDDRRRALSSDAAANALDGLGGGGVEASRNAVASISRICEDGVLATAPRRAVALEASEAGLAESRAEDAADKESSDSPGAKGYPCTPNPAYPVAYPVYPGAYPA